MARTGIKYQLMHRNSEDFMKIQEEMPGIIAKANIPVTELIKAAGISYPSHYRKLQLKTFTADDIISYLSAISEIQSLQLIKDELPSIIVLSGVDEDRLINEIGTTKKTFRAKQLSKNYSTDDILSYMRAIARLKSPDHHSTQLIQNNDRGRKNKTTKRTH